MDEFFAAKEGGGLSNVGRTNIRVVKREKVSSTSTIMKNLNMLKVNDS